MKKTLLLIAALLGLACGHACAQTQTLSGILVQPDGTPINGRLVIGLQSATFKNICSTPYQVVPTLKKTFNVVNGVLQGDTSGFTSSDCLTPRYPYYAQIYDTNNALLDQENWYLPRSAANVVNLSNMAQERMGSSPIAVSLPVGIVSTPSQTQTITQPTGTSLIINGNLIINGTVTYTQPPPSFTQLLATQVLIGGITTSTYSLDVQGIIDATQGYAIGGSGGVAGQCIVSNGTAGVWGTCTTPALPALYNQQISYAGGTLPQRNTVDFEGPFTTSDDATNSITTLSLNTTGNGSYVLTTSAPLPNSTNCAAGDGVGGIQILSGPCGGLNGTITDLTGTNVLGTAYKNTSTGPMQVYVTAFKSGSYGQGFGITCYVGPTSYPTQFISTAGVHNDQGQATVQCLVPAGDYYMIIRDDTFVSNPQPPTVSHWITLN